jgi:hypothetical protein
MPSARKRQEVLAASSRSNIPEYWARYSGLHYKKSKNSGAWIPSAHYYNAQQLRNNPRSAPGHTKTVTPHLKPEHITAFLKTPIASKQVAQLPGSWQEARTGTDPHLLAVSSKVPALSSMACASAAVVLPSGSRCCMGVYERVASCLGDSSPIGRAGKSPGRGRACWKGAGRCRHVYRPRQTCGR